MPTMKRLVKVLTTSINLLTLLFGGYLLMQCMILNSARYV